MVAIPDTTDSQTNLLGPMPEGVWAVLFCQHDDALGRPMSRNADAFGYNERGEVVFPHGGTGNTEEAYAYDGIGNHVLAASGGVTNAYTANALNQYASILSASAPPCATIPQYDADGNLLSDGTLDFTYNAANRLVPVSSNGVPVLANFYDANSRRVKKVTPEYAATFFYDDWNLVEERIVHANGTTSTIHYYWGKDLSGTWQGAGGIGGLLYLTVDGVIYIPCYDNNGNVTRYLDADGNTVARYAYDAFGNITSMSGILADFFRHRFSTKYFDGETSFYYYGYRFYHPPLMRWLNRDPIEENGGVNLYGFCGNNPSCRYDKDGCAHFEVRRLSGTPAILGYSCFASLIGIVPALILDFGLADKLNIEILHEHLFYDDGTNVGYSRDGIVTKETSRGYRRRDYREYDDCIMKEAQSRVTPPPYSLLGIGRPKYNCQDYADSLRRMYDAIKDDPNLKCKCKGKAK